MSLEPHVYLVLQTQFLLRALTGGNSVGNKKQTSKQNKTVTSVADYKVVSMPSSQEPVSMSPGLEAETPQMKL